MSPFETPFGFTITAGDQSLSLRGGDHARVYPSNDHDNLHEHISNRQIDLLRIATAVHVADGWACRKQTFNGRREIILDLEVLDAPFWNQNRSRDRLTACVNFISGDDSWNFRFQQSKAFGHKQQSSLFRRLKARPIITLYSGGLDSAAGLASRIAEMPGTLFIPVSVCHQTQREPLIDLHFKLIKTCGLSTTSNLKPFLMANITRKKRIKDEFGISLRETTHRCRPFFFMSAAGIVADSAGVEQVEVYESGVGSINLPLRVGSIGYRTTRSTHPHFLRLLSELVSHVNDSPIRYVLPFSNQTKSEMAGRLKELGLDELARKSVSCTLHPIKRGNKQCGHCAACIFRRQALWCAGIKENKDTYLIDLFSSRNPSTEVPEKQLRTILVFHQQISRLAILHQGNLPTLDRNYLIGTRVVHQEAEFAPIIELHTRYLREWESLIAEAKRYDFPWVKTIRSDAIAGGLTP